MATLSATARANLPDSAFAYIDAAGVRRLPINDAAHVRNALARFEQVAFEDDAARERARERVLRAARKYGIVPIGFFDGQLRKERQQRASRARAAEMRRWPRGTVTFLLTDIEGSTALLQRLDDAYTPLLRDVRALIRASVRKGEGHEVDARADEFFAAFASSANALDSAIAIQRAMSQRSWPRGSAVSVRIGIHTGRPTLSDAGYVGLPVHTAARICAAGHGGQILVSDAARAAIAALAAGTALRSLGDYSLPSLQEPMRLYQVEAVGLRAKFPRLRA
ncbi:MAG TPA: adenylate/guanylate cyclase domain-containing protein [Candidatus Limnocylindria bacterium]|nr:adenylate/guanylate cyclase domain-containing protein [Candidatus Limnocylindria bacterium]